MAKVLIALFLSTLAVVFCEDLPFEDCGSKTGIIQSIDISDCHEFPCIVRRGTSYEISVEFTSMTNSTQVNAALHALIFGQMTQVPLENPDGCTTGINCPIKDGYSYVYQYGLIIPESIPEVRCVVQWELHDDKGEKLVCLQFPAIIA